MKTARFVADTSFTVGEVDPRLFGGFIEHLGRAIYGGIYEPDHPTADDKGFRGDVLDIVRRLGTPIVRYPGGNFVSGYNWEDGVGPVNQRPARLDLAWKTTEPNLFGTNEFVDWARAAGSEVMMAVNLGTRGIEAASNLVEYCNHPGGSYWSDLRAAHGYGDPHGIRSWCLGNEMDGPWQIGQKTAVEYGRLASEAAKAMRLVDPDIDLVACGSSYPGMPTFPAWEETVLDHLYDQVDFISLHIYLRDQGNLGEFLAQPVEMERYIQTVVAACDLARAKKRSNKTLMLSFDEWNVWYHARARDAAIMRESPWQIAPPLTEESYNLADAVVLGLMIITLLRHADRVRIACIAQLVNALSPIMTVTGGPVWLQSTFFPFLHASQFARGTSLILVGDAPQLQSSPYGNVPALELAATFDSDRQEGVVFAVNRSLDEPMVVNLHTRGFEGMRLVEQIELTGPDPWAANSPDQPNQVFPSNATTASWDGTTLEAPLAPLSWSVFRFSEIGN